MSNDPLRIVTFNFQPFAYNLLTKWIEDTGNKHILAVTTPGPTTRPTPAYKDIVTNAPRNVDVLVTTRIRNVATPLIRELKPDLIMCFSFPYKLTPELIGIPRLGTVNLHPSVLPAWRGPNPFRMFYEGADEYGFTCHWMDAEFDTGNILSQRRTPTPDNFEPDKVFSNLLALAKEALYEGMERAIAGEAGTPQDDSKSSYAARFTAEEYWLDLSEPRKIVRRKGRSLNMTGVGMARIKIEGQSYHVMDLELVDEQNLIVQQDKDDTITVQASDGALRLTVQPLEE
jgi:methionyl-tRNA formyltransferase